MVLFFVILYLKGRYLCICSTHFMILWFVVLQISICANFCISASMSFLCFFFNSFSSVYFCLFCFALFQCICLYFIWFYFYYYCFRYLVVFYEREKGYGFGWEERQREVSRRRWWRRNHNQIIVYKKIFSIENQKLKKVCLDDVFEDMKEPWTAAWHWQHMVGKLTVPEESPAKAIDEGTVQLSCTPQHFRDA